MHRIQTSLDHCPMLINTDQNSGIDPKNATWHWREHTCQWHDFSPELQLPSTMTSYTSLSFGQVTPDILVLSFGQVTNFGQVTPDRQTDIKRCISAHCAYAQVCSKTSQCWSMPINQSCLKKDTAINCSDSKMLVQMFGTWYRVLIKSVKLWTIPYSVEINCHLKTIRYLKHQRLLSIL